MVGDEEEQVKFLDALASILYASGLTESLRSLQTRKLQKVGQEEEQAA